MATAAFTLVRHHVQVVPESLEDYEGIVDGNEVGGLEFVGSVIELHDGEISNITEFKVLPMGQTPEKINFVPLGKVPATDKSLWSGAVVIAGVTAGAEMYRTKRPALPPLVKS